MSQRAQLDYCRPEPRQPLGTIAVNPGIEGIIESYELAFRMQDEVPTLMDWSKESKATQQLYGIDDDRATQNFGRQCLLARRFVEAGVRFVEVCHGDWDQHRHLKQTDHAGTPAPSTSRSRVCSPT